VFISLNPASCLLLCLFFLSGVCFADSLILKDGSEFKGEIISDNPKEVVIEYLITPTIKDQKTFPREEIEKIVTITKEEKDFLSLGDRATPNTVLNTSFYDPLIDKKLPEFLKQYPYSRHIAELRDDLQSLIAERERVRQGERRVDGSWITTAQIASDPYQSLARIQYAEISLMAFEKNAVGALKKYELLETNTPGANVIPEALDLASSQLDQLQGELIKSKSNFSFLEQERKKTLSTAPADQAKEMNDVLAKEALTAKTAIANATKDGTKFFPIFPNNKEALDALQTLITSEKARLTLLQAIPMRESLKTTRDAARLIALGQLKEAQAQLDIAEKYWPLNAEIASLKKKIEEVKKLKEASQSAASAAASVSPSLPAKP
jgi:hypothetical protein